MQHDQIIKTLEGLIPKGVEQGPENVLLKYASDNNLAPAQLERLAQMYNVAMTLNFMDKSANRGGSFNVIDVPDLLSKFTDPVASKEAALPDEWSAWFDNTSMNKAASAFREADNADDFIALARGTNTTTNDIVFNEAYEKYATVTSAGFWEGLAEEATTRFELDSVNQMIYDAEEDFRKVAHTIEDLVRTGADFQEMAIEAQSLYKADGVKAANALHNYLKHTGLVGDSCSRGAVRIIKDTWKSESLFKEAAEALSKIASARNYLEFCKESAGQLDNSLGNAFDAASKGKSKNSKPVKDKPKKDKPEKDKPKGPKRAGPEPDTSNTPQKGGGGPPKNPRRLTGTGEATPTGAALDVSMFDTPLGKGPAASDEEGDATKTLMDLAGAAREGIQGITDPETYTQGMGFDTHLQKLKGLGSGVNKTQKGIDQALSDAQGVTTVQRLMMTDPIISKADPELVVSLTNTLAKASPQVRNDPNLLRMALREAIQYEAIPMHTFKDLIEMEQRSQATRDLKQKNEDAAYKI